VLAVRPVDFRCGHDALAALVQNTLGLDPHSGLIVVFRSKRKDRLKILLWDGTGLVMIYKRLGDDGGFSWPQIRDGVLQLTRVVDLKARGLVIAPEIAVGDGALGFWKALDEAFPSTRHQRCWQHKTLNVLDKLPKSVQPAAHRDLREIWLSPDRASADFAITTFAEKYAPKYDKAVDCLLKDHDALLTFFDFPAEHWAHLRTLEPDRERVRDGAASHGAHEGRALAGHCAPDGVQAGDGRVEKLATTARPKSVAKNYRRRNIP
jgi:hypothetical protein